MSRKKKLDDAEVSRITFEVEPELKRKVVIYCAEKDIKSIKGVIVGLIKEKVE